MCAVPALPAHPRLQPRDLANRQVGVKRCRALIARRCSVATSGEKQLPIRSARVTKPLIVSMCAVPSLPAHPRLQPRDSANRQVGLKTMPGPSLKEAFGRRLQSESAAGPQHSARSTASPKCRCTPRLLGWVPLAQGGRFTRGRLTANPPSAVAYAPPPQQSSRPGRAPQTSSTMVLRAHARAHAHA